MIIGIYFCFFMIIGILTKINVFNCLTEGVKNGLKQVFNIFPSIFVLNIFIDILLFSTILDILKNISEYFELIIQMFLKLFSYNSSLIIMDNVYNKYGIDSFLSYFSTFIQSSSDTTFYVLGIYLVNVENINKSRVVFICLLCNVLGFIYSYLISLLLFK